MWVYLDVIERRFTNVFQALEKKVVNNDLQIFSSLPGASPFACWQNRLRRPNQGKKCCPYSKTDSKSGRMTISR